MKKLMELYRRNNKVLGDAFDKLVVNIHMKKEKLGISTLTLCGTEPGVGTTTIAISVAISFALSGWKTLLIDGDMRKNIKFKRLSDELEGGLSDYLNGKITKEEAVYTTNCDLMDYLPSGTQTEETVRLLCSAKLDTLLEEFKKEYDFIIVDSPSVNSAVDTSILVGKTDASVLVTALNESDKVSILKAKSSLHEVGVNVLGVIINKIDKEDYSEYMKYYDYFDKEKFRKKARRGKA